MKADDQNMDEQFRKAAAEIQFSYRTEFWNEVEAQLADDSMDSAFRSAAGNLIVAPAFSFDDDMADAYLDEAFSSAASTYAAEYSPNHWQEFLQKEAILEQDVAFMAAANSVTADYHSAFWSDADIALQNEGLHYEYQTAYWNEARQLLDRADRRIFFMRWSAVAAILLFLSVGAIYQSESLSGTSQGLLLTENNTVSKGQLFIAARESKTDLISSNFAQFSMTHQDVVTTNSSAQLINGVNTKNQNTTDDVSVNTNLENYQNSITTDTDNANILVEDRTESNDDALNQTVIDLSAGSGLYENNDVTNTGTNVQSPELIMEQNADPLSEEITSDFGFSFSRNHFETNLQSERLTAPTIEIKKLESTGSHKLSFTANAGVGNRYSKFDFTPSLRTTVGIEYMHKGYGKLRNLEFGGSITLYHTRQNDFGTERHVNVFNTDGGVDKFWYKLQLKDMIYSSVSGVASYALSRKQNVRFSVGVDYLMFVQSNMSYQLEADKGITTVNNNWGVKDGLNKFDLRMGLGYEYQFTQRFAGQVNGNFGFFDRTDDQFIEKSFFDQEMSITVGFKYTFLRKS
ncbi:MAG: hypothetical protein IPH24_04595 [Crocinitomicaceae bacterium]|nr:hypothetical protein [Crocinitomicaceae bacterium]